MSFKCRVNIFLYVFNTAVSSNRYKLYRSAELVIPETEASLTVPLLVGIAFDVTSVLPSPNGIGIDVVLLVAMSIDLPTSFCPLSFTDGPAFANAYLYFFLLDDIGFV